MCIFDKELFYHLIIALMLERTSLAEIVFWILFVAIAFESNIHWSYLVLPGVISSLESLMNNYYKNKPND